MAHEHNPKTLAEAGRILLQLLKRHRGFVRRTVERYEADSKGGQVIYGASVLRREIEGLETVLAEPFDFTSLDDGPPDTGQHVAMARFASLLDDLGPTYDPAGYHQTQIRSDWANLSRNTRRRLTGDVPKLQRSIDEVSTLIAEVLTQGARLSDAEGVEDIEKDRAEAGTAAVTHSTWSDTAPADPDGDGDGGRHSDGVRDRIPGGSGGGSSGGDNANNQGDGTMTNGNNIDGIIDAISRLQGAGGSGGGTGTAANAINAFSNDLDQTINLTLGMPSLSSDAARALSSDALVDKLFEGLDRTVADSEISGVTTYEVNPLRARGAAHEGQGLALGAQAVSAATIRNLKEPIMANVYKLVAETTYGEQDEAEDLRIAISSGLDQLIAEANADVGIYQNWAQEIILQIGIDLFRLASQYGLLDLHSLPADMHGLLWGFLFADEADGILTLPELYEKVLYKPAIDRILRDPDIGILTAESNDKAFSAIVHELVTIARLIPPQVELGPLVGRIRALNDALPASVISARNALAVAGISEADQAVAFSKMVLPGDKVGETRLRSDFGAQRVDWLSTAYVAGGISLRRLLAWIEAESLTSRTAYLREDLNQRDIQRLIAPRVRQSEALNEIIARNFPMVNTNDYAIGRRHLIEVREHLEDLVGLMRVLVASAEAQSA
ncbi:MAG: hypothetical protein LJE68_17125 [Rhodobacter sp.]|nr:hypothetical protein [Rhodobacter sp.]